MSIKWPRDPQQRIEAMLALVRGRRAIFEVDGERVVVTPMGWVPENGEVEIRCLGTGDK
jgi:hypothetical protein